MSHINLDIYNPSRVRAIFKRVEAERDEFRQERQREHDLRVKIAGEYETLVAKLRAELTAIAEGSMECGCMPCRGSCRSADAYEAELDAIRNSARTTLQECSASKTEVKP